MKRRIAFWTLTAAAVALVALGLRAFWLEPASLIVVSERIQLPKPLPGPLRVAVVTDLYIGSPFNGMDKLDVRLTLPATVAAQWSSPARRPTARSGSR